MNTVYAIYLFLLSIIGILGIGLFIDRLIPRCTIVRTVVVCTLSYIATHGLIRLL